MIYYSYYSCFDTDLLIACSDKGLIFLNEEYKFLKRFSDFESLEDNTKLESYNDEIDKYLKREIDCISFSCELIGTEFEKLVWHAVINTSFGSKYYFSEIAMMIGNPDASRAVARALKFNPILILIPSHRVVQKNKKITGSPIKLNLMKFES